MFSSGWPGEGQQQLLNLDRGDTAAAVFGVDAAAAADSSNIGSNLRLDLILLQSDIQTLDPI